MDLSLLARKIETGVELVDSYTFNILHFGISYGREKFCSTGPRTLSVLVLILAKSFGLQSKQLKGGPYAVATCK